jgi:DNA modification methylase
MTLHTGNCRDVMAAMEAESVHAIVTDPPYGMSDIDALDVAECLRAWLAGEDYQHGKRGFMGREWDGWVPGPTIWREAFRVLKPGGHMVVCAAPRVQDLTAIAIRLAGFEIRDCAQWLFGSGFPKSHDVSKAIDRMLGAEREVVGIRTDGCHNTDLSQHKAEGFARSRSAVFEEKGGPVSAAAAAAAAGFGTALKPAHEPIIIARKPFASTVAACFCEHGTGALNIDACRIPHASEGDKAAAAAAAERARHDTPGMVMGGLGKTGFTDPRGSVAPYLESMQGGRWPANVMLGCACDGEHDQDCAVRVLDEQSGTSHAGTGTGTGGIFSASTGKPAGDQHGDFGGASRFFYTAKASRSEREAGLEHRARFVATDGRDTPNDTPGRRGVTARANFHPTVKPVSLMRWLVKLVGGKRGNVVLDPFMGSGTTGVACALEGFAFIGVDLDPDHVDIARGRIARAAEDAGTLTAEAAESAPPTAEPRQLGLLPVTP